MLPELILIFFYLLILLYTVIIHEVSHGVVALWLGDKTAKYANRLNLNPIHHVDMMGSIVIPLILLLATQFQFAFGYAKPVPYNPYNLRNQQWGPSWVALAGPGSNFLLALLAALLAKILPVSLLVKNDIGERFFSATGGAGEWLERWGMLAQAMTGSLENIFFGLLLMIVFWNVLLGVFNLIPIPPLDGSKLLFSLFNFKPETVVFFEQFGFIFLLVLILSPLGIIISVPLEWMLRLFFGVIFG